MSDSSMVGELQVISRQDDRLLCQDPSGARLWLRPMPKGQDLRKQMERARRKASWLQHPGWYSLRDFILEDDQLYVSGPAASSTTIEEYLQAEPRDLSLLTGWLVQLTEMLMEIHNTARPLYLGRLTCDQLRVSERGTLQLIGLDVDERFRLSFVVPAQPAMDARGDLFCLGELFVQWLDWSGEKVRAAYRENRNLRELIGSLRSPHPERRPSSANILKSRLEQLKYRQPQEARAPFLRMPAAWELMQAEYQQVLIGAVATFVTGILVMGWLFPA